MQAQSNLFKIRNLVPPCVAHAVLCTWLNGWATSRRYQQESGGCRFNRDCRGRDEIEHYAACAFFRRSLTTSACIPARSNDIRQFLLVDAVEVDMLIKQAVAIFAAYGTFNKARAKDTRFDETTCRLVALERIRFAISRHKRVKVAFGQ